MNLLRQIIHTTKQIFKKWFGSLKFINVGRQNEIIILDDIIPSSLSPWRAYEFNLLIKNFPNSNVLVDLRNFYKYNLGLNYDESLKRLIENYIFFDKKVKRILPFNIINHKLAYTVFFINIKRYFQYLEKSKIYFIFTLYPGGGFLLNNDEVNSTLKEICSSPFFRGLFINQYFVKEYLIEKMILTENLIHLIHGIPLELDAYRHFKNENKDFDKVITVLFFANKYQLGSTNKGWDTFQNVVKKLSFYSNQLKFMVIGGYGVDDLDSVDLREIIDFKGVLEEREFCKILGESPHILISPNSPNLKNGAFDGFPLGTCVSTGYLYNTLFMSDYYGEAEKSGWIDGEHFIKISTNTDFIVQKVLELVGNKNKIKLLSFKANLLIEKNYSIENQVFKRLEIFKNALNSD